MLMLHLSHAEPQPVYGCLAIQIIVAGPFDDHGREVYSKKVTVYRERLINYEQAEATLKTFKESNPGLAKLGSFHAFFIPEAIRFPTL